MGDFHDKAGEAVLDQKLVEVIESIDIPSQEIACQLSSFRRYIACKDPEKNAFLQSNWDIPHYEGMVTGYCFIAMALSALAEILDTNERFEQAARYLLRDQNYRNGIQEISVQLVFFVFEQTAISIDKEHFFFKRMSFIKKTLNPSSNDCLING
jgi:hypothetical protein